MKTVPIERIRLLNDHEVRADGDFVLYWMIAFRRTTWNFSLQRAVEIARDRKKPLVILEALKCDYRWASDRLHRFIIDGMIDNAQALRKRPVTYYPYLEPKKNAGRGLITSLAERAVSIVTDDFPSFFLPHMIEAVSRRIDVSMEAIDSNGIYPMRSTSKVYSRAHFFRRHLQRELPDHLDDFPAADPLARVDLPKLKSLPQNITDRWPPADLDDWTDSNERLAKLPIDHDVPPTNLAGGCQAASERLDGFIESKMTDYQERNHPDRDVSTGLSPYLHFGHISSHEVVQRVFDHQDWDPSKLAEKPNGSASGWWGMSEAAENFLDEIITWREVGYNMCANTDDYDQFDSLPDWAIKTLEEHADDRREHIYSLDELAAAETHDSLWNAAQRQLLSEGKIHNYLRMLWGKKILQWTEHPRQALDVMIELNNKYALDGRNPNSYSGIFWVLGRYDRAWGPERPIFGKIRYMTSDSAAKKLRLKDYLKQYGPEASLF